MKLFNPHGPVLIVTDTNAQTPTHPVRNVCIGGINRV